ncbi:MAG: erythromycin esterase family protein, partial [Gammaproteobacteria bacterium]|nr:erythromycin esterase family protein [Gammaproteobacteria bacterium]MDX2459559.1 erythromycin esterase family protein [Gammaproteobacteria bacterium]
AAASNWDEPMEIKTVRPAMEESYEKLSHASGIGRFMLGLRDSHPADLHKDLSAPRLERAIGVIYRPETELASHYFQAILPAQFDEYIWFDETSAVAALKTLELEGLPDTYPFGV